MRTEQEKLEFCGTICMAARKLGIYGRFQDEGFMWFDPMANATSLIPNKEDKKFTLEAACEELIKYLEWKSA